jgi:ligand-binding sensor domain-containing protein/serine phosphatase RsbU (regulator of sigma subunit)
MAAIFKTPISVPLNTEAGYTIHPLTGDSIHPIINSLGDTLITGVPIPAQGRVIDPGSVSAPRLRQAGKPEVIPTHLNVHNIPKNLRTQAVHGVDLLKTKILGAESSDFVLVNSTGDTVRTGIPIPLEGKEVPFVQPNPEIALPPGMKENAILDIQYLDVYHGMFSSQVISIVEDSHGQLWFGTTGGGASMYDGQTFSHYTKEEGLCETWILSSMKDSHSNLWFGTMGEGVIRFNGENFTHITEKEGLSNNLINCILEDSRGHYWFGTDGGGICLYDGESLTHFSTNEGLSSNWVLSMKEDSQGHLWFGTSRGVCMYDGQSFLHYAVDEIPGNIPIQSIEEDSHGNLWFATRGAGVMKYDGESFTFFTEEEGLSSNPVNSILEDRQGRLWFGTTGAGAYMYNGSTFTHVSEKEGLSGSWITQIVEDSHGNLWLGTIGGGISIYNSQSFQHYTEELGLSSRAVYSILEDSQGRLWFGTMFGGANLYDGLSFKYYGEEEGLSGQTIESMLEDSHGNIWFGTASGGVSMFDGSTFTQYTEEAGLSNISVGSILEDSKGQLWFGTLGGGVSRYNGESFTHFSEKEGLSSNLIGCMMEDRQGRIWFGTMTAGVSMFDGQSFLHISETEGVNENLVQSIMEDGKGNIWLSTEDGLNLIRIRSGNDSLQIHSFKLQDGLKGTNFISNSVLLDSKNRFWWGSNKCLTMLDLNKFQVENLAPRMQLKGIDLNGQSCNYRRGEQDMGANIKFDSVARFFNYPIHLELPYEQNHLTFHYSAINWAAPHKVRYAYKMTGFQEEWNPATTQTQANYRNLPFGSHTFMVRAIGEAQVWSEPLEYTFTIKPPWWQSWLARIGYGILAFSLVFAIVQWRTSRFKKRQRELELTIKERTLEVLEINEELNQQNQNLAVQRDEIQTQKDEIQEQKQAMTDSIEYAKRIQTATLPPDEVLKYLFPKHFVLYRPLQIVSGDFYWLAQKEGKIIVAVADCTGHGVPGAFMSMLGSSLLNDIVNNMNKLQANLILNELRDRVILSLRQTGEADEARDGMDITLCVLDREQMELQFSGAHNPLYHIRDGKLTEVKADSMPIGISSEAGKSFTNHQLSLKKDDALYLFSDGYADQAGGEKRKRFMTSRLKSLLLEIQDKIMFDQKAVLERRLNEWMGHTGLYDQEYEQIDDIVVMGIKV